MAYFSSPCQRSIVNKVDAATTTPVIKSTYQTDYTNPKIQIREELKTLVEASLPPDYLSIDSGMRILPATFRDVFRNCISASIGEKLELKFTDDTPDWKYSGRAAAARYWQQDYRFRNNKLLRRSRPVAPKNPMRSRVLSDITEEVLTDQTYTVSEDPYLCNYYYGFYVNK